MSGSFTSSKPLEIVQAVEHPHFELPFGAQVLTNNSGVHFRFWAPDANSVDLVLNDSPVLPMTIEADGWTELVVPNAKVGDHYGFRINNELIVADPASRYQVDSVHDRSQVMDPNAFQWTDGQWKGRPWEETVIYELHVGTFTPEGTYRAIISKLDYLKDLGITAIELMPIAQFPGERNWGYDGVLLFAPENRYGTPDDLKALVQAAHDKGLMIFLDVVYNHFGPDGNYLPLYAKRFFTDHHKTPWGDAINFESSKPVRDFAINNALYWLNEFHMDGLRLDAVHAIKDDSTFHFLNELAGRVRTGVAGNRHIHLVLENDGNQASFLSGCDTELFNAQWNDDFHHAAHVALTGEVGSFYADYDEATSDKSALAHLARCLMTGFAYQEDPSPCRENIIRGERSDHLPLTAFVNFFQNHDQIGNRAFGNRLTTMVPAPALKAALTALLLSPSIPMLFMGEEWQSKTPFQFFCDFEEPLRHAITKGRRQEFGHISEFSDPKNQNLIPDPCERKTFETSKLNWNELKEDSFAEALDFTRSLLKKRQAVIVPLCSSLREAQLSGNRNKKPSLLFQQNRAVIIAWPLAQEEVLLLSFNLGEEALTLDSDLINKILPWNSTDSQNALIFESNAHVFERFGQGCLEPYSAVYLKVPSWKP